MPLKGDQIVYHNTKSLGCFDCILIDCLISRYFIYTTLFPGLDPIEATTWDGINDGDSDDKMIR